MPQSQVLYVGFHWTASDPELSTTVVLITHTRNPRYPERLLAPKLPGQEVVEPM